MRTFALRSSWLRSATYEGLGAGEGLLVLETCEGRLLAYGPVPAWLPGLLRASRSPGRAFHRLVRGRYALLTGSRAVGGVPAPRIASAPAGGPPRRQAGRREPASRFPTSSRRRHGDGSFNETSPKGVAPPRGL